MAASLPFPAHHPKRTLNVLVAVTDPSSLKFGCSIIARLQRVEHVALRVIAASDLSHSTHINVPSCLEPVWHCYEASESRIFEKDQSSMEVRTAEYCAWADLLVLAPLNAEDRKSTRLNSSHWE